MGALMHKRAMLAATLLLASCIPASKPPARRAPPRPAASSSDPVVRQCLADLGRDKVRYTLLPDRVYGGGCSAVGAVQLDDIGTPVTKLGPMTCPLVRSFARWTRDAVQPAASAWFNTRVVRIESFGTYGCRTRNSRPGARLSEHGRANAVDIGAFVLADGRRVAVLDGWNGADEDVRHFLRAVHQAGCRRFSVTLGPDADAAHRNHLHFDMGAGPYCR